MTTALFTLTLTVLLTADVSDKTERPRQPNPFAPSLPLLTGEEEDQIDQVIDQFIRADIGKLRGAEAKKAVEEFQRLRPEAIPALIRGMNRAAHIEASCPAVVIAKKLAVMLNASDDLELLEFARENIGAGVTQSRHMGVIKDLRVTCMLRKRVVMQNTVALRTANPAPAAPNLRSLSTSQLVAEAASERGPRREQIVRELQQRPRDQLLADLGSAAGDASNPKGRQGARELLGTYLSRQGTGILKENLKHEAPEVRAAAARVVGNKGLRFGDDLIDLLADDGADVREAAHQALVRLNRGTDLGPERDAGEDGRAAAVRKWRDWWARQGGR
jgi:hypothetical protein